MQKFFFGISLFAFMFAHMGVLAGEWRNWELSGTDCRNQSLNPIHHERCDREYRLREQERKIEDIRFYREHVFPYLDTGIEEVPPRGVDSRSRVK